MLLRMLLLRIKTNLWFAFFFFFKLKTSLRELAMVSKLGSVNADYKHLFLGEKVCFGLNKA